jgi:hypothetical protein
MEGETPEAEWSKTLLLKQRLRGNPLYEEPYGRERIGRFAGRQIIARDIPINGGVYLGSGQREAIVVDDQKYPQELDQVYQRLRRKMKQGKGSGKNIFDYVNEVSKEALGGSQNQADVEKKVDQLVESITKKYGPDTKVALNNFIRESAGLCRHRSLLAGYLIERLVKEGVLRGKVSIDRNYLPDRGGHAWVRWEGEGRNQVIIIDPSLNYVGRIENAPKTWDYKRPKTRR